MPLSILTPAVGVTLGLVKKHYGWRGWSPEVSASWRRFWRSAPPTPEQTAQQAAARIAAAEAEAESLGLGGYETAHLLDPYDDVLLEFDPQLALVDKQRRVPAGQRKRARARRAENNQHRKL